MSVIKAILLAGIVTVAIFLIIVWIIPVMTFLTIFAIIAIIAYAIFEENRHDREQE